jgi:hypothetical protein
VFFVLLNSSSLTTPRRAWWNGKDEENMQERRDLSGLFRDTTHYTFTLVTAPYGGEYRLCLEWGGHELGKRPQPLLTLSIILVQSGEEEEIIEFTQYGTDAHTICAAISTATEMMGFQVVIDRTVIDPDDLDKSVYFDLYGGGEFGVREITELLERVAEEL